VSLDTTPVTQPRTDGFQPASLASFIDLLGADFSAAADLLVYAANSRDGLRTCEESVLWGRSLVSDEARVLSSAEGSQSNPVISPDGATVAFLQEAAGCSQLCVLDLASGKVLALTDFERGVAAVAPQFSPDGRTIVFAGCAEPKRDPAKPYRVTRPVWRRDGMGLVEDVKADLYLVAVGGGEPSRLTSHDGIVSDPQFSPDGTSVLYGCFAEPGSAEFAIRVAALPGGGEGFEVMRGEYLVYPPATAWLPDGRVLHTTAWQVSRPLDLVIFDPLTGTATNRGIEIAGQISGYLQPAMNGALLEPRLLVDDAGENCLLYVQNGGRLDTCAISLSGPVTVTTLAPDEASTVPLALRGSQLLLARTSFTAPLDLYLFDTSEAGIGGGVEVTADASTPRRLTDLNAAGLPPAPFTVRPLAFEGEDGTAVEGWFLEPTGGAGPYPTVLNIHGGPFAGHGQMFSLENYLFAAAGLGVLCINFRGSSGYGEAFAQPLWADWAHHDAGDLLAGIDAAVAKGWVDGHRIGSFGLSGGGYLTSWLLTHSDRFKAGVAECPVTDWNGMVGSDIPQVIARWMGSDPGTGPEAMALYAKVAPATYAADCTTPMLIIVHEADLRCPAGQGDVLYNALSMAGREVEMLRLPNMFHTGVYDVADLSGRIIRAEAVLEWLTSRLLPTNDAS